MSVKKQTTISIQKSDKPLKNKNGTTCYVIKKNPGVSFLVFNGNLKAGWMTSFKYWRAEEVNGKDYNIYIPANQQNFISSFGSSNLFYLILER